ncbi:hypothetical protein ACH4U5_16445 [Streptomyces sp. NPDC020858]|uniref:hypothetical protein n=1 Tax=Streptomyces sp. NPDC020858 TaxID=3365097 RepID=UPI003787261B
MPFCLLVPVAPGVEQYAPGVTVPLLLPPVLEPPEEEVPELSSSLLSRVGSGFG